MLQPDDEKDLVVVKLPEDSGKAWKNLWDQYDDRQAAPAITWVGIITSSYTFDAIGVRMLLQERDTDINVQLAFTCMQHCRPCWQRCSDGRTVGTQPWFTRLKHTGWHVSIPTMPAAAALRAAHSTCHM